MFSFVEAFWVVRMMFLVMLPLVLLLRDHGAKLRAHAPTVTAERTVEVRKELPGDEFLLVH
jgi:hypothetical protein